MSEETGTPDDGTAVTPAEGTASVLVFRLSPADRSDPHLTEQFKLFGGGRDLANGFTELNDRRGVHSIKDVILIPTLRPEVF